MSYHKRTRTRGSFGDASSTSCFWRSDQPKPADSVVVTHDTSGQTEEMTDFVTPGYSKAQNLGEIVNNEMSSVMVTRRTTTQGPEARDTITAPPVIWYYKKTGPHWTQGILRSPDRPLGRPGAPSYESLRTLASTRCLANVSKPEFTGLVSLGEIRETLSYLRNPFKAGLKLASTFEAKLRSKGVYAGKRGRARNAESRFNATSDIVNLYLEFRYAVRPLASEITGIMETLRARVVPRPVRQTSRTRETQVFTDQWTAQESVSGFNYNASYGYTRKVEIRCGILYENVNELTDNERWGMRFEDIPSAAWELVPLSFVADWFGNVGDLIAALTPRVGIRQLAQWEVVRVTETMTRSVGGYVIPLPTNWTTFTDGSGQDFVERTTVNRRPRIQVPSFAMKDLTVLQDDVGRILDLIGIFNQKVTGLSHNDPIGTKKLGSFRPLR